ncbi:hypothetical protein Pryu01_01389 [Paraliobacillus ryukyuensis]|uniref:DUF2953 family protein n=1 Tax=Paraliobacillus ryukyuensis TaxID=200904 RepID=A0A366ECC2_9BACI|nr:DUF2953 domain-containing protein [Paraliobacillus ryukyuensis]RBO99379.1 DUF2953 family protein [Paraliobacillus ryukyuensis]
MFIAIGIVAIIFLLLLLLLFLLLPVKIYCNFAYEDEITVFIKGNIAGIPVITYDKKFDSDFEFLQQEEEVWKETVESLKNVINKKRNSKIGGESIFQQFKKVRVESFQWHTIIGLEDAATTGMVTGALWSIKGGLLAAVDHFFYLDTRPNFDIATHFNEAVFQSTCACIFSIRLGQAMRTLRKINKSTG